MLAKENFSKEYIQAVSKSRKADPLLLERSIYAFGLLEALVRVDMPFLFKGGTSLMLLLKSPKRLSTDIDVIVEPETDVEHYLEKASKIFPFRSMEQQVRNGKNHYNNIIKERIGNEILITQKPYYEVSMPSVDCILGDKLTAFAPYTTGIPYGVDKELEIIKQMYDVACLAEVSSNFKDTYDSYMANAASEIAYRGLEITAEDALKDTIETAACVAGRGIYGDDYPSLLKGIKSIGNHIYGEKFSAETAVGKACRVMYVAASILKNTECHEIKDVTIYRKENIGNTKYAKLSSLRKLDQEGFAYLVEAVRLLENER